MRLTLVAVLACASLAACNTYRDELGRSQRAFDRNAHEHALALLRDLERDLTRLAPPEQAQYAYLRGMTDYRIGHKADARHWLAIAHAYEERSPGILPTDWTARMTAALDELDGVVHERGYAALGK
jgi:hypothetical protein